MYIENEKEEIEFDKETNHAMDHIKFWHPAKGYGYINYRDWGIGLSVIFEYGVTVKLQFLFLTLYFSKIRRW